MCRREQLWGIGLLALGIGLLVGCWVETQFWRICFGVCFLGAGFLILQKK